VSKNKAVESQIRLFTDAFEMRRIPLAHIDTNGSLPKGQNRRTMLLDDEHVFGMVEAASIGVEFPPLIVNEVQPDCYVIIDGNHRRAASEKLGRTAIAAYVVKVDPNTFHLMCLSANAWIGKPLPHEAAVDNALAQIELGLPATTVSKLWGIPADRLQFLRRQQEGRRKVAEAGLKVAQLSGAAAELANRLELEHITKLGAELTQATSKDLEEAVRIINAAPAASRNAEARRQSAVLERKRQARTAPKSRQKGALSAEQARTRIKEVLIAVRSNRALLDDDVLVQLVDDLWEEAVRGVVVNGNTAQSS